MSKNTDVGEIICKHHDNDVVIAFVRKDRKDKFYYHCPECGLIAPKSDKFQKWVLSAAVFYDADKPEEPTSGLDLKPDIAEEKPKKSILKSALNLLGSE